MTCVDCWRRDNLTPEQMLDQANAITGTVERCAEHQAVIDRAWATMPPLIDLRQWPA